MLSKNGPSGRQSVAATVAAALAETPEVLSIDLLGRPDYRSSTELRWGEKASRRVTIAGPYRGRFQDFRTGDDGDMLDLIRNVRGCSPAEALAWARSWLGDPTPRRMVAPPERDGAALAAEIAADLEARTARALALWDEATPIHGTPALGYFRGRGLVVPEDITALRFHPRCPRGPYVAPAVLGLLKDAVTGEACGVSRTYLARDCRTKAEPARQARRMLGRAGGAAIMLSEFSSVTTGLAICEGIETALALLAEDAVPIWACGSAGAVAAFPVLDGIESLTIYADADRAGLAAAETSAARWRAAGREARVIAPAQDGKDWADLIQERAA